MLKSDAEAGAEVACWVEFLLWDALVAWRGGMRRWGAQVGY